MYPQPLWFGKSIESNLIDTSRNICYFFVGLKRRKKICNWIYKRHKRHFCRLRSLHKNHGILLTEYYVKKIKTWLDWRWTLLRWFSRLLCNRSFRYHQTKYIGIYTNRIGHKNKHRTSQVNSLNLNVELWVKHEMIYRQ